MLVVSDSTQCHGMRDVFLSTAMPRLFERLFIDGDDFLGTSYLRHYPRFLAHAGLLDLLSNPNLRRSMPETMLLPVGLNNSISIGVMEIKKDFQISHHQSLERFIDNDNVF